MAPDIIALPLSNDRGRCQCPGARACISLHNDWAVGWVLERLAVTRQKAEGKRGGAVVHGGVVIKIKGTTYVVSWRGDCCAVYPKT